MLLLVALLTAACGAIKNTTSEQTASSEQSSFGAQLEAQAAAVHDTHRHAQEQTQTDSTTTRREYTEPVPEERTEKYYALKQDTEGNAASDARIRRALKVAEDTKNRELADLSGLLAKYRDFETQRAEIRRQGNEDIAALEEQRTEAN